MWYYNRYRMGFGGFLFCLVVVVIFNLLGGHGRSRNGAISVNPQPTPAACQVTDTLSLPSDITTGPDGKLWFTKVDALGSITTQGVFGGISVPTFNSGPQGIVTGADGRVWFTEQFADKIGRMTLPAVPTAVPTAVTTRGDERPIAQATAVDPSTGIDYLLAIQIQEFPLKPNRQPYQIVRGPDGNLWFTEQTAGAIGRITPSGRIREFKTPTAQSSPTGLTAGPDGNLWFTEQHAGRIGRITPAGVIAEFRLPKGGSNPVSITLGPDGNLWFTEDRGVNGTVIGRVTPAGRVTEVAHTDVEENYTITTGPDGNLWLTGFGAIVRVTPRGAITEYDLHRISSSPYGITSGPDGNLWFTEPGTGALGRISPQGSIKLFPLCIP